MRIVGGTDWVEKRDNFTAGFTAPGLNELLHLFGDDPHAGVHFLNRHEGEAEAQTVFAVLGQVEGLATRQSARRARADASRNKSRIETIPVRSARMTCRPCCRTGRACRGGSRSPGAWPASVACSGVRVCADGHRSIPDRMNKATTSWISVGGCRNMVPRTTRASRMMSRWATMKPMRMPGESVLEKLPM